MDVLLNASDYLVDRHVRDGRGERVAIVSAGTSTTYAQLQKLTAAFAGGLSDLAVRRGERVLFVCSDGLELAVGILGAMRFGAVAVPVSTMLNGAELAKVVVDSGARVLMATPEFAGPATVAAAAARELAWVVTVDGADVVVPHAVGLRGYEELLRPPAAASADSPAPEPPEVAPTGPDTPALWLYTSGTTGDPKGAMHRHANLVSVCETYAQDVLAIGQDDVCFSIAKMFFAYGLGNSLLFPLSVGARTVLEPRRPSPEVVAERMRRDRPTLFFGAPTFYATLLAAQLPTDTFASVRLCASAGEALPAALYGRFTSRFGVDVLDGIGSTEALHIFLSNHAGEVRPGTSGRPVRGYELDLRDADGHPVPDGVPGGLFVRGASIAAGYWCRADASRQVFRGEWLCTGDTYSRSPDGYFTCLGRSNDLLKAGGIWVSPAEVEERLLQFDGVAEAAVVGIADSNELDKPVAFVVAEPGASLSEAALVAWCRDGLAAFKRPRAVVVVEELPKTATGKVQRYRLRELADAELLSAVTAGAVVAAVAAETPEPVGPMASA